MSIEKQEAKWSVIAARHVEDHQQAVAYDPSDRCYVFWHPDNIKMHVRHHADALDDALKAARENPLPDQILAAAINRIADKADEEKQPDPQDQRLMPGYECPKCHRPLFGPNETCTCSGSFTETDHPSAVKAVPSEPEFHFEYVGDHTLKVSEIWPDGDAPENPTVEDVLAKVRQSCRQAPDLINDWNLGAGVLVNGKDVWP